MKQFFDIMAKDILSENFTQREYVVYGIIAPIAFVIITAIGGMLS